jgi:hypothetical protein
MKQVLEPLRFISQIDTNMLGPVSVPGRAFAIRFLSHHADLRTSALICGWIWSPCRFAVNFSQLFTG